MTKKATVNFGWYASFKNVSWTETLSLSSGRSLIWKKQQHALQTAMAVGGPDVPPPPYSSCSSPKLNLMPWQAISTSFAIESMMNFLITSIDNFLTVSPPQLHSSEAYCKQHRARWKQMLPLKSADATSFSITSIIFLRMLQSSSVRKSLRKKESETSSINSIPISLAINVME